MQQVAEVDVEKTIDKNKAADVGLLEAVAELVAAKAGVDWHCHRAQRGAGIEVDQPLRAIAHQHADVIAMAYPGGMQRGSALAYLRGQCLPAQALAGRDKGLALAMHCHGTRQLRRQGHRLGQVVTGRHRLRRRGKAVGGQLRLWQQGAARALGSVLHGRGVPGSGVPGPVVHGVLPALLPKSAIAPCQSEPARFSAMACCSMASAPARSRSMP